MLAVTAPMGVPVWRHTDARALHTTRSRAKAYGLRDDRHPDQGRSQRAEHRRDVEHASHPAPDVGKRQIAQWRRRAGKLRDTRVVGPEPEHLAADADCVEDGTEQDSGDTDRGTAATTDRGIASVGRHDFSPAKIDDSKPL